MAEMEQEVKIEHAPLIKNLFYADKKPNSYFMVIAEWEVRIVLPLKLQYCKFH